MMLKRVLLGLAAIAIGVSSVRADFVVGTNGDTNHNGGVGVGFSFSTDFNIIVGQEFTLNSALVIDSITLWLNGDGTNNPQSQFLLQVMDQIGPTATAANVLYSATSTFPLGTAPNTHDPVSFGSVGLALGAGTYFLVASSAGGTGSGWGTGADVIASALGTVGPVFVNGAFKNGVADYTFLDPTSPNPDFSHANFAINRIDAVPEPTSIALLMSGAVTGLVVAAARRGRACV